MNTTEELVTSDIAAIMRDPGVKARPRWHLTALMGDPSLDGSFGPPGILEQCEGRHAPIFSYEEIRGFHFHKNSPRVGWIGGGSGCHEADTKSLFSATRTPRLAARE